MMYNELYRGMSTEERAMYSKKDFVEMKEAVDAGVMSEEDYVCFYVRYLMNLIKKVIHDKTYCRPGDPNYEDLISDCVAVICEQARNYNPELTLPGTFFWVRFEDRIKECIRRPGISSHYNTAIIRLKKIAKEQGCDINDLKPQVLAILADLPISTVIRAMELANCTSESLDAYDDNIADARRQSPEDAYIQNEERERLYEAAKNLSPLERYLLYVFGVEKHSIRQELQRLKSPEYLQRFGKEVFPTMDQCYLQRKYNKALRKMKKLLLGNAAKRKHRATIILHDVEIDMQASVQDILDGMFTA